MLALSKTQPISAYFVRISSCRICTNMAGRLSRRAPCAFCGVGVLSLVRSVTAAQKIGKTLLWKHSKKADDVNGAVRRG